MRDGDDHEFELTEGEAERSVKNPFIPKYSSHKSTSASSPTSNSPGHVHTATESSPPGQTSLSSSAGASSQLAQPGIPNSAGLQASPKKQHSSTPSSSTITTSRGHMQPKNHSRPCKVCGQPLQLTMPCLQNSILRYQVPGTGLGPAQGGVSGASQQEESGGYETRTEKRGRPIVKSHNRVFP